MEEVVKKIESKLFNLSNAFFNPMGYRLEMFNIYIGEEKDSYLVVEFKLQDKLQNNLYFQFIVDYGNWLTFACDTFVIDTVLDRVEVGVYLQKFMKNMVSDLDLMKNLELYSILAYNKSIC